MIKSNNSYNPQRDHHNIIGFYGEPKAPAYLAKAISFYSKLFLFPFSVKWEENQRKYKVVPFNSLQKVQPTNFWHLSIINMMNCLLIM